MTLLGVEMLDVVGLDIGGGRLVGSELAVEEVDD